MLEPIIQEFIQQMEVESEELENTLPQSLDFSALERKLTDLTDQFTASILQALLNNIFTQAWFLTQLRTYAGTLGMRFKEYRPLTIQLNNGCSVCVMSPYFIKTPSKRKKKRRQKKGEAHLALRVCGFVSHVSPNLLSKVVQMALLCPSYAVAQTVLEEQGIRLNVKTIRRLCQRCFPNSNTLRSLLSLQGDEAEALRGKTLVISADGGRIRERKKKRGRRPKKLKQQGYDTNWKEPKLFTIYLLDEQGQVEKTFPPIHDATMGDHTEMFFLLKCYLDNLDLDVVKKIVFTGDGGCWIWNGVEQLIKDMRLDCSKVHQVLDHIHAKQNLEEIIDLATNTRQATARGTWQHHLWNGEIDSLEKSIKHIIKNKENLKEALNKFNNYFKENEKRMQYKKFKNQAIPCGSGHVESAIRRVINLRLKAPGTFWLKEMAECFLYLRSQLISGRWSIFMKNLTALTRLEFIPLYNGNPENPIALKTA